MIANIILFVMRKTVFATGEVYHVFNLGVEKRQTFTDKREYDRALLTLDFYRYGGVSAGLAQVLKLDLEKRAFFFSQLAKRTEKLVDIFGYCLMPNHFHLLLKQLSEEGISTFIGNSTNSYTRYFNMKHKRIGHLFQGVFKAARIEKDEQLIHVLRYIHLNPVVSYVIKETYLEDLPYCSFSEYLGKKEGFCNKELILSHFSSIDKFKSFTYDQIDYGKRLEVIKHLTFE